MCSTRTGQHAQRQHNRHPKSPSPRPRSNNTLPHTLPAWDSLKIAKAYTSAAGDMRPDCRTSGAQCEMVPRFCVEWCVTPSRSTPAKPKSVNLCAAAQQHSKAAAASSAGGQQLAVGVCQSCCTACHVRSRRVCLLHSDQSGRIHKQSTKSLQTDDRSNHRTADATPARTWLSAQSCHVWSWPAAHSPPSSPVKHSNSTAAAAHLTSPCRFNCHNPRNKHTCGLC